MVETSIVNASVYSVRYLSRSFCKRLRLHMRRGPYGASKILASAGFILVSFLGVRRSSDSRKGMELFVGVAVGTWFG